jgi:hypothetical protein
MFSFSKLLLCCSTEYYLLAIYFKFFIVLEAEKLPVEGLTFGEGFLLYQSMECTSQLLL